MFAWGTRDDGVIGDGEPADRARGSAIGPIQVPGLQGIVQITAGRTHNLALARDGHILAWGKNADGELGIGTRFTAWRPTEVKGLDRVVAIDAEGSSYNKFRPVPSTHCRCR